MRAARSARLPGLFVELDAGRERPMFRQLYDSIRQAVLEGRLHAGAALPPSRGLAAELGVSRNTVTLAYDQLAAEGYLQGQPRSGVRVATHVARPARSRRPSHPRPVRGRRTPRVSGARLRDQPLSSRSDGRRRPARRGRSGRACRRSICFPCDSGPGWSTAACGSRRPWATAMPPGINPLREAIADYVGAARGTRCSAEQIIVVNGSQQGLDLAARVLLDPGDEVWMEDPGYPGARAALLAAGAADRTGPRGWRGHAGRGW